VANVVRRFLHAILPRKVEERVDIILKGRSDYSSFRQLAVNPAENVTVLFADLVDFTHMSSQVCVCV
jgi:class 3 adenylate cyclase